MPIDEYKSYLPPGTMSQAARYALPALEYAGKKALSYYQKKRKMNASFQKAIKNKNYKKTKTSRRAVIRVDGTTSGRYRIPTKKKRRRRKKSLRQQISQVRRLIPKKSHKTVREFRTVVLPGSINEKRIFDIKAFSHNDHEDILQVLTLVDSSGAADYRASNTSVQISTFYKLMLKNNATCNVSFSYAFYVCKEDDNESPVDSIREELVDRGYTTLPTVDDEVAKTDTNSFIPRMLRCPPSGYHIPVYGAAALKRKWRIVGKVATASIGPGDTSDLVYSKKITYKPEINDQEATQTYLSNYDVRLVITLMGDLAHDQLNTFVVGRGSYQLDCEEHRQQRVTYANPKGLDEVLYFDNLTNTNFSVPVHADDHASKMETDET